MKILQIINSHALQDGGAQRLALDLHRAYRTRGHDSHLLSLMRSPTEEIGTYSLGFPNPYRSAVLPRLLHFLSQDRWCDVHIIHVHLFPAQLWVPLMIPFMPRQTPARLITTEHNTFNRRRATKLGRLLDRFTLRSYERIVCVSPATAEALSKWQPQQKDKLKIIANGIDLSRYAAPQLRSADQKQRIVLAVGRIAEQKNYETAIRAVAKVDEENFELWIAGQDEMKGQMQRLSIELGQNERIRFLGYRSDVPDLLQQADVFLLTSRWEGFGLAVAEAMAAGLPVIASDVPGVREVVGTDGSSGFLVDPSEPDAVAARLGELLKDPILRSQVGLKAQERAAHFDVEHTIESHLALYREVSSRPSKTNS